VKLNGQQVHSTNFEYVIIPRRPHDLVFKCQPARDWKRFNALCKEPTPGKKLVAGGGKVDDTDNPMYRGEMADFNALRFNYLALESLKEACFDGTGTLVPIEWETVEADDPQTWKNWRDELAAAGLTLTEIALIEEGCLVANALSERRLKEARDFFFATMA
jgi:hypothetical protein